jgi:hypothetical protein
MSDISDEERKRIVAMLAEWEQVRAGVTALRIIGEVVKWTIGIIVAIAAVLGITHTGVK